MNLFDIYTYEGWIEFVKERTGHNNSQLDELDKYQKQREEKYNQRLKAYWGLPWYKRIFKTEPTRYWLSPYYTELSPFLLPITLDAFLSSRIGTKNDNEE